MKQCFRIALWMFLLTGYLQAKPVNSIKAIPSCLMRLDDLGFGLLSDVSCEKNVTFTSPTNVKVKCHSAALEHFKKELEHATVNCDEEFYIKCTLEALELDCLQQTKTNCNFTMMVHENFADFINATKRFVQQFNDHQLSQEQ